MANLRTIKPFDGARPTLTLWAVMKGERYEGGRLVAVTRHRTEARVIKRDIQRDIKRDEMV